MTFLVSLADLRDGFIIVYGTLGIIFFFIASIITLVVGLTIRGLVRNVHQLLEESIKPTVTSIQEAAETFRGTTEFVGKTAIAPIVRAYGTFAGVRKGLSVISGLTGRRRR